MQRDEQEDPSADIADLVSEAKGEEDPQRTIDRLKDDLDIARSRVRVAEKRMHATERFSEQLFGITRQTIYSPSWTLEKSQAKDAPHVPVLVTSDFQLGEVIDRENMDGINEYNVAIAQDRYRTLITKAIEIGTEWLPKNRYEGMIYLRLGDGVSGDIHEDLRNSNDEGGVESVRSLVGMESWGVKRLAEAYGNVHVISVPGNHGRTSLKPPTKAIAETNYDTLAAWWLEDVFKSDKRVTFATPNSMDAMFEVHGRRYLATHGDRMGSRGGEGYIGPSATILRGFKRVHDEYARRNLVLEAIFCGHFHCAFDLGVGWSNGSLPGYSEYARSGRMTPEPPRQWLLFFHPKYGPTSGWKVRVDEPGEIP